MTVADSSINQLSNLRKFLLQMIKALFFENETQYYISQ